MLSPLDDSAVGCRFPHYTDAPLRSPLPDLPISASFPPHHCPLCQEGGETHQDLTPTLLTSSITNYSKARWAPWRRGSCTVCLSRRARHLTLLCLCALFFLARLISCLLSAENVRLLLAIALPSHFKTNCCQLYADFSSRHAFCSILIAFDLLCLIFSDPETSVFVRYPHLMSFTYRCSRKADEFCSVCSVGRIISAMGVKGTW